MSTLIVTNIKKTGETVSRDVSGVAAAWVHGDSSAVPLDSLNISGGVDNGVGDYRYTYTNAMSSTSNAVTATIYSPSGATQLMVEGININDFDIGTYGRVSGDRIDRGQSSATHGDLS